MCIEIRCVLCVFVNVTSVLPERTVGIPTFENQTGQKNNGGPFSAVDEIREFLSLSNAMYQSPRAGTREPERMTCQMLGA